MSTPVETPIAPAEPTETPSDAPETEPSAVEHQTTPEGAGDPAGAPGEPAEPVGDAPEDDEEPDDAPEGGGGPASDAEPQEVKDLPELAQKLIRDARSEAARSRVQAKEQAAKEARNSVVNDIGRALGLIQDEPEGDDEPEAPSAEDLVRQLSQERESTQSARVELAVYKLSGANEADPAALLDSRAFLDAVKKIDPTDTEAMNAAIAAAVESNPRLKAPQVETTPEPEPVPSGGSFAGGPSGRGTEVDEMSIDDFRKHYKQNRRR